MEDRRHHRRVRRIQRVAGVVQSFAFVNARVNVQEIEAIASPQMVMLAAALCLNTSSRSGKASWGMILAMSMGLVFYILGNAGYMLASGDRLPAAFAAWLPSLAFGGIAVFLLLKNEGH